MRPLLTALLLAAWAQVAQAAEPLPDELASVVEAAELAGLPTAPLEAKAREGLAKGVPAARIAVVLEGMHADMAGADRVLSDLASGAERVEIVAAATLARRAGASDDLLRSTAALTGEHRARALRAVADLLDQQVPPDQASSLVALALDTSDPGLSLREITVATSRLRLRGHTAGDAAAQVTAALSEGLPPLSMIDADLGGPLPAEDGKTMPWQAFGGNAGGQGLGQDKD